MVSVLFTCTAFAHDESDKLFPSDANDYDSFGTSATIDGDIAVVGAYLSDSTGIESGATYVYELTGPHWLIKQKLVPSDSAAGDKFGRSVAVDGNTIAVGSYYDDENRGAAYVYTRTGAVWTQQQKLVAPDAAPNDKFGCSVAIDNNTIVIGAYCDDSQAGSASVFTRIGSTWTFLQKLTASDTSAGDFFGTSVAIDGNTIIVGSPYDDYSEIVDVGSAYIYQLQGSMWVEEYILRASDGGQSFHLGFSVALDSNRAVVGAYEGDVGVAGAGAAYVFEKSGSNWAEQQKLFDTIAPFYGEDFGWSVAIKNGTILVGCPGDYVDGNQPGSVFEFVRTGTTWVTNDRLTAADGNANDKFGSSLAFSGRNIIIGSPYNVNNGKSTGSAYIFNENYFVAGDLDSDFDVDFIDFAVLAGPWRQNNPIGNIAPVLIGDGIVNVLDLAVLGDNWLSGRQ